MSAVSTTGLVMSLLGLTSLAGAGIAVGSGISMVRSRLPVINIKSFYVVLCCPMQGSQLHTLP